MNSTKLTLIALGFLCISSAFSFTALNLPIDNIPIPETEDIELTEVNPSVTDVVVSDNTNLQKDLMEDTILIDLSGENLVSAFPNASKDCILKQVPYPEFAREKQLEGGVATRFQFDEHGNINVLETCSNSAELEQYVRNKLASLQLKNCVVDVNKDYYLRFMFRLF